jgi:Spy/CpxP family protein refolding chaperone
MRAGVKPITKGCFAVSARPSYSFPLKRETSMRFAIFAALMLWCGSALAQQQPYAGMETRAIKSLSDEQVADLNAGRGMGLALAAELNGYPGPSHALELADRLALSPEQATKLKELFAAMKAETIPIGAELISQERGLNEDFARRTITPAGLEATTRKIGTTQAALRSAHLKYHLSTVAILTPEQVKQYGELRGYAANAAPAHQHRLHP